jgi:hypothetical protein
MEVRFTKSARRHRIGRAHALHVISTVERTEVPADETNPQRRVHVGPDDRGVGLQIVAIVEADNLIVIHVMPVNYRRRNR